MFLDDHKVLGTWHFGSQGTWYFGSQGPCVPLSLKRHLWHFGFLFTFAAQSVGPVTLGPALLSAAGFEVSEQEQPVSTGVPCEPRASRQEACLLTPGARD